MKVEQVGERQGDLGPDDDHPYRSGAWRPGTREYHAWDLPVVGEIPQDLDGVYLRNTENPVFRALGRYHPFDGDGMVHALRISGGRAEYHNRFVRTRGLAAELDAGRALWAGLMESPAKSERDGWGARTRMKDASSTDVVVHAGRAVTSFYQCGDLYQMDPVTLEDQTSAGWVAETTDGWGVSAHTKVDEATGEMLFFNYAKRRPYMHYGLVDGDGRVAHYVPIELPGPRLPHDMAFTERYAILNDLPLFWDPEALRHGAHAPRFYPEMPSRFAVVPRRGRPTDVVWFEAQPTFVLHWINAYEAGDEIVLDGFFQGNPTPKPERGRSDPLAPFAMLDLHALETRPYRWRLDLRTGQVREGHLSDQVCEFGMINPTVAGRRHRYTWCMRGVPGWFLFNGLSCLDVETGQTQDYRFPPGIFASESPMAPPPGSAAEDEGYVITFVSDLNANSSSALIFDASNVGRGPVATIGLPERICVGTHACWAGGHLLEQRP